MNVVPGKLKSGRCVDLGVPIWLCHLRPECLGFRFAKLPRRLSMRSFVLFLVSLCLSAVGFAQKKKNAPPEAKPSASEPATTATGTAKADEEAESPWKAMKYRLVGPYRGGRAVAVTGVIGHDNTYYFGSVAGGVWKTTDGGLNWTPVFDKAKGASPAIGAIAVAPSDPNVIYVGTGEACIRGNVVGGNGVYKSIDAGKTWNSI